MFVALAGSELALGTGTTPAPPPPAPSADHFLAPAFVQTLVQELAVDAIFGPIMRGAAGTLGRPVDRHGAAVLKASRAPPGGTFLVLCGLLYRLGQGEADRLCIPAGGGVRAQVLRECHDGPLGGHFGRAKTGSLVRRLVFWVGQDSDLAEYVCTCQTCQQTKAEHGRPRGLLHPLPLPSRRGGMIGVDWIAGLCKRRRAGSTRFRSTPTCCRARCTQFPLALGQRRLRRLRSFATCAWDRQLPLAVFAINKAASTLGDGLTPFFIDRGAHPRLPLTTPAASSPGGE